MVCLARDSSANVAEKATSGAKLHHVGGFVPLSFAAHASRQAASPRPQLSETNHSLPIPTRVAKPASVS